MKKNHILQSLALVIFTLFLMSPSCEKDQEKEKINSPVENTTTTQELPKETSPITYTFTGEYKPLWKQVDSLENLGLYESALNKVQVIFENAQAEKNAPQVVKAVIFKMKYNSYLAEDDYVLAIDELNSISQNSSFPLKQIIHSVTAEVYWGYYQNNRWKFMNRTQTVGFKNDDIRTWDLTKIVDHVNKHHLLALSNKDSLQRAKITDFSEILIQNEEKNNLRPTLYDFLANRALDFFETTEAGLIRPEDKFVVSGKSYFGDAASFIQTSTNSKDSLSNALHATKIFKDLTTFHMKDSDPAAFINLELRRLRFSKVHSIESQKNEWFIDALNKLAEKWKSHPSYSEIRYVAAEYHNNLGSPYNAKTEENRWEKKRALEICDEAIKKFPESFGASQCSALMNTIQYKNMSFTMEAGYTPLTTGKILFKYQNIDSVYFRIVKVDDHFFLKNRNYGEELMSEFLKKPTVDTWSKKMNNPGDYQSHSTELLLKTREYGQYVILASPNKDFRITNSAIAYGSFWVTDLSFTYRNNGDESYDVFVSNRETGEPQKSVSATIYIKKYNYVSRSYDLSKQESYTTDANGMFTIRSKSDYRNIFIDLSKGKDHFNNMDQIYQHKPYKDRKAYSTTHFFTDRNIYRPGQTIHFKGIRIHHNDNEHTLETGKISLVELFDANYQKVSDLKLTTNEYGTFSGTFTAPAGGLNGQMQIKDPFGSKYFSVEEYKRPKFEVEFQPITGEYKIGQKVSISGTAKSYAGSNIDDANVQYRVTRTCVFPYWSWYRWGYVPQSPSIEISNGTIKTDENGVFTIEFVAKEDPSIDKKYFPNYTYTIVADVTDMNGETRSDQQWVRVGYNAMNLSVGIPGTLDRKDKNRFKVNTTNLNGEKVKALGSIKVFKIIEPEAVFRSQIWERPDIQEIDESEYKKLFPHDPYKDENELAKFAKGEQVLNIPFNTSLSDSVDFVGMKNWQPGRYLVEGKSIDSFGVEVTDLQYIVILDKSDSKNATKDIWTVTPLKIVCEPGENAEFLIASASKDLKVIYELEHQGKIIKREVIVLSASQKLISIPIEEKHRGNIMVHFITVKNGRAYNGQHTIIVPFSNKSLDLSFETFRDKLQPGQKEEWKLKIKGPKGEKVAAEMLAAMYDASLDAFASNSFYMNVYNSYYSSRYWYANSFQANNSDLYYQNWNIYSYVPMHSYNQLNWWGYRSYSGYDYRNRYNYYSDSGGAYDREEFAEMDAISEQTISIESVSISKKGEAKEMEANRQSAFGKNDKLKDGLLSGEDGRFDTSITTRDNEKDKLGAIQARSNLNETAFFFPHLRTDANGDVSISFTIPEALTTWKFMGLAHTKDLKTGFIEKEIVTQKELMVMPNPPRFLREGDKMTFTAKVSNLSDGDLDGTAQLFLFNAATMESVDLFFENKSTPITFSAKKGQSARLAWDIVVPSGIGAVTYRVVAQAKNHTDGEEMVLPILSNRMLVTESLPLPSKGIGTKEFTFTKLVNSSASTSIKHHKLTLEYTSNPAWYAIQAMPYMMEYPYECAEQIFTRYYSNALASNIVNSSPKIKEVFESWKESSPEAFLSNLEKNQELKSLILEETPWVLDAQNESERKKRVGLLFDLNKMDNELDKAMRKLQKLQVVNGGWPWFPGMEESRYITQHIVTGLGHLDHLGVKDIRQNNSVWTMVKKGVRYLDERLLEDYQWVKKHYPNYLTEQHISEIQVQYFYTRSYFKDMPLDNNIKEAFEYYQSQAATYWKNFNIYNEGMIALQAHRYEIPTLPAQIMASLKERAILHEELGMYWKDNAGGYYWYQAPIETQALLIEAFDEVSNDLQAVEELKVWLLKQKQTTDWKTTKATAEACYALLLRGTDLLTNTEQVEIKINGKVLDPAALGAKIEAGTGYFKTSWDANSIIPELGNISVTRKTTGVSWGAMYWQYFEDLDKITTHETPLKLNKKLFLVENTASGPVIKPITDQTVLKPGDKIRVRIELRSDRDMEYVHMKDMRASGLEPINVFSRYKWQDGLGYYESTKDAATNFFIDYLPKGTYVFEYDLRVSHFGDFSNGITTIQSMYAPEFTSHSEGVRIKIVEGK